jgi:glycosyltransferase involved in cell wall biosynthesis
MLILSHPTGNANVRNAANGLQQAQLLKEYHTSIAVFHGSILYKLAQLGGPFAELKRRTFDDALQPFTKTYPCNEFARLLSAKLKLHSLIEHEKGAFCIDAIYHKLDAKLAKRLSAIREKNKLAVYAYEDGAAYSFQAAKKNNIDCIYDLPIGYWRSARLLLGSERDNRPDWASTLTGFKDSEKKLARKDEELKLADHIFVASSFTAKTLQDYPGPLAPISVIPYGFPPVYENRTYENADNRPLKVLFVGGLSQRKGIANLLEAVEAIGTKIDLTIVGRKAAEDCIPLNSALAKYRWIPSLPHEEVLALMRTQDVLVFPSLFEGFGLVITEAMSQGTPVITTDRTAGPDLIEHGKNGWLVEAGSTAALQKALEDLIENPQLLATVGKAAMETARQRPWEVYGKELAEAVAGVLGRSSKSKV